MHKHRYRITLVVLTIACGVCTLVLTATMAFDAPDRDRQVWPWIVFFVVMSIPFWFVFGAFFGWAFYLHGWP